VMRGGSWYLGLSEARSAHRAWVPPERAYASLGLRPACSLP
jgi:formylglycine-generating enzyme required for sulfatase activity